jgi:hypothetical protein
LLRRLIAPKQDLVLAREVAGRGVFQPDVSTVGVHNFIGKQKNAVLIGIIFFMSF